MFIKKCRKRSKGFTLVELMITVAIVVVLSMIAGPIYKDYTTQSKKAEVYSLVGRIRDAQINYYNEYGSFLENASQSYFGIKPKLYKYVNTFQIAAGYPHVTVLSYRFTSIVTSKNISGFGNVTLIYDITDGATYI